MGLVSLVLSLLFACVLAGASMVLFYCPSFSLPSSLTHLSLPLSLHIFSFFSLFPSKIKIDSTVVNVALLQMMPSKDNLTANIEIATAFCIKAAQQGADIALFPEMWNIGK
jgi:hypothetical protein